ncbi:hypothetical protein BK126_28515 [Paenibacillus sp. FSL H7-0326]|uniref:rolling circle replication-associated protein n=1 Tax=Paenibacillus sp. FSL H7-0326 TaxID=1921144 RepID=UPI00096EC653|nr:hypothetical protein [Paenibacillus sp. FSL H7-0326]OMC62643.1 hypothetical protein BK126_28515 [Paenibacillus sp. FSL H7-0326]
MSLQLYQTKVFVSGNVVEVYQYELPIARGYERSTSGISTSPDYDIDLETGEILSSPEDRKLSSRAQSNIRARNNLRRLALMNFTNKSKFLTLTTKENITDLEESNKHFKAFIRKLKKECKDESLKYLAVIEFQKRGAVHYHMLCNLPYVRVEKIRSLWRSVVGEGNIDLQRIDHVDNIGAYVIKYMTKEDADPRLIGKKMYQCSKGLTKPREVIGAEADKILSGLQQKGKKIAYSNSYRSKHLDCEVVYSEYNLDRQSNKNKL